MGCAIAAWSGGPQLGPPLNVTFIDVEGGQATLLVTPSRESILIDAGSQRQLPSPVTIRSVASNAPRVLKSSTTTTTLKNVFTSWPS